MGYATTIGSIKRAITEGVHLCNIPAAQITTDSYTAVMQMDLDLSQLNFLGIGGHLESEAGGTAWLKVSQDGNTMYETSVSGGTQELRFHKETLVAGTTKVLGTFKVELKNATSGKKTNLTTFAVWGSQT